MKKLILFTVTCIAAVNLYAQTSGGPDAYGYIWRDSNDPNGPAFNWIDITGLPEATQVTGFGDDDIKGPFPIGFTFHYYWYDVTNFRIGSNGYILFDYNGQQIAHPFPLIPLPSGANDYIAPFSSDLNPGGAGNPSEIWYYTTSSNDSLIVSWIDVPFWLQASPPYTGSNTFQIILSKLDSSITFQYLDQQGASANTGSFITIGIENISGTIGLQHSNNVYPPAPHAIKFYYPQNVTLQIEDASVNFVNNPISGGLFLSKNGSNFTMSAEIKNTGNQNLNPFPVDMRVVNQIGTIQIQDVVLTNAMSPSQTQSISSPLIFNPTIAGPYSFVSTTQLSSDVTPSNNVRTLEVRVVDTTLTDILLTYTGNFSTGSVSWSGGDGGTGVEIVPPFYPAKITELQYFIVANPNGMGFAATVFDDSGPNGEPGALLDSIVVPGGLVIPGIYNPVVLPNPIIINQGSFYVGWMMMGENISIGLDGTIPISNRTFEILGNIWAPYRGRDINDIMINAVIQKVGVGIEENEIASSFGNFYPSPASHKANLDFHLEKAAQLLSIKLFNMQGQLISSEEYFAKNTGKHSVTVDVSKLSTGLYVCEITAGNEVIKKKLVVGR